MYSTSSADLVVHSAEVVDQIDTIDGPPIVAQPGTQLVLIKSTFTARGPNAADLSCGDSGLYIRGYDSAGSEMTQIFETRRIPGNIDCSNKLLTGQSHDWNLAFTIIADNSPDHLLVIDSAIDDFETETTLLLK